MTEEDIPKDILLAVAKGKISYVDALALELAKRTLRRSEIPINSFNSDHIAKEIIRLVEEDL